MKIISVWSPKGGVGKTTLAAHIAAGLAQRQHRVMGVDLDPQESWIWISSLGRLPYPVLPAYPDTAPDVDYLIVDHAPRADFPPHGGLVVVPLRASALDYRAYLKARGALGNKKILLVLNAVDGRRTEEQQVVGAFPDAPVISNLAAIPRVTGAGATVFHSSLERLASIRTAREQFNTLLESVVALTTDG